jgi:hypothetical protein
MGDALGQMTAELDIAEIIQLPAIRVLCRLLQLPAEVGADADGPAGAYCPCWRAGDITGDG